MKHPFKTVSLFIVMLIFLSQASFTQDNASQQPVMVQDSSLNNLVLPEGYQTAKLGELGHVEIIGNGSKDMILIAGLGFGWEVFQPFIDENTSRYTMYAVSMAGMGGTQAPPMPPEGTSYVENTWMNGTIEGVLNLLKKKQLHKPAVMGSFVQGASIAFRLAIDYPEKFSSVIIAGGSARVINPQNPGIKNLPLSVRSSYIDTVLAPNWFKTVTENTWDTNNYYPENYSRNPEKAQALWEMVTHVPVPVMVRYLCEFYASDVSLDFNRLKIPALVLLPDFDEATLANSRNNFLTFNFGPENWENAVNNSLIELRIMPESHLIMMADQPEKLTEVVADFIEHGVDQSEERLGLKKPLMPEKPEPLEGISLTAEELQEYAGSYGNRLIMMDENTLYIQRKSGPKVGLTCVAKDEFVVTIMPAVKVNFSRDGQGVISEIRIFQNGQWTASDRDQVH